MDVIAPAPACRHLTLSIATERATQFIDLTERLEALIDQAGIDAGLVNVQALHTTAGIAVNEHEPLLLGDVDALLERLAPVDGLYAHDDMARRTVNLVPGEPANGHAHCRALLLGQSASLHIANGRLRLGRWQRVFLVELDGPRARDVSVLLLGSAAR